MLNLLSLAACERFGGISRGESFFSPEFVRAGSRDSRREGGGSEKCILNTTAAPLPVKHIYRVPKL